MPAQVLTSIDLGSPALEGEQFRDELLTFSGIATVLAGTLLARRSVATAVTASAVTGTGNGTVTLATVVGGPTVPIPGVWTIRFKTAVANGGVFQLEDPNGRIVETGLTMTPGAGATTVFKVAGLQFSVTDGSTDFAAGDTATLTVAADGKIVPFAIAGAAGVQSPIGVLTYAVTSTGAGDVPIRMLSRGVVNKNRLIIDADGTGANITNAILDQLRDYGITPVDVLQSSS
jgi:hypothetical protein